MYDSAPLATREDILNQLQMIQASIKERYAVSKIGVFGSVARNQINENSDIDIVVHMEPNLLKRVRLKAELENYFGQKVDVIRYRESMNPYLKSRIDRDVIYV